MLLPILLKSSWTIRSFTKDLPSLRHKLAIIRMQLPAEILLIVVKVRAPGLLRKADFTDVMTKLCHKRDLLNVRAACRDFNDLCEPIIYRFLVEEILTRRQFHLHQAVSSSRTNSILRLIEDGAPVSQKNADGETPLHIASRNGYVAGIEALVRCNKDIDEPTSHGWTALQLAARYGHDEVIAILLQNGADPDIRGFHGWTALHYATRTGHQKAVDLLIGAGARVDILDNDQKAISI